MALVEHVVPSVEEEGVSCRDDGLGHGRLQPLWLPPLRRQCCVYGCFLRLFFGNRGSGLVWHSGLSTVCLRVVTCLFVCLIVRHGDRDP